MNRRLLALSVGAAATGAVFAWVLYMALGSGGTAVAPTEDSRTPTVIAFVPELIGKLGAGGPEGIYAAVDHSVQAVCSREQWIAAFAGDPPPGAFRKVDNITYNSDGTADVRITMITQQGDRDVVWKLSFLPNGIPKVLAIPGSEECTPRQTPKPP